MQKITLKIDGMACGMCEAHINDVIRREFNIKKVSSSYKRGETILLADEIPDEDKLKKAIADTGYSLISVSLEPYKKIGLFKA